MLERGVLIPIGGHEDREGARVVLHAVADALRGRPLLIVPAASRRPARYLPMYRDAFAGIGVELTERLEDAGGIFLTGGSQKKLVAAVRDTSLHEAMLAIRDRGGVVAGTSAGASALGESMIAGTEQLQLATGLGLIPGVVIDQHFTQRNRLARLSAGLGRLTVPLGLGIDEDTAVVLRGDQGEVIGSGTVTVLRGGREPEILRAGDRLSLAVTISA